MPLPSFKLSQNNVLVIGIIIFYTWLDIRKGEIRLVTIFLTILINPYSTAKIFTTENTIENVTISIEVCARLFQ
jgi:uncharacterized membrane protein YGL010W